MSVKVRIPPAVRELTGNQEVVETTGKNVGECIDNLASQFPRIKRSLLVNCFEIHVNPESVYAAELSDPVKDGDELTLAGLIVAGGG